MSRRSSDDVQRQGDGARSHEEGPIPNKGDQSASVVVHCSVSGGSEMPRPRLTSQYTAPRRGSVCVAMPRRSGRTRTPRSAAWMAALWAARNRAAHRPTSARASRGAPTPPGELARRVCGRECVARRSHAVRVAVRECHARRGAGYVHAARAQRPPRRGASRHCAAAHHKNRRSVHPRPVRACAQRGAW